MKTQYWLAALGIAIAGTLGIYTAHWLTTSPSPQSPAIPSDSAVAPSASSPTLEQIASQLARDGSRAGALDQLKRVPYQQIDQLRRLEDATPDPRVKTDLEAHVIALQEQLAADPPPISLHVKDAQLETVSADLGEAMAVNFLSTSYRLPGDASGSYTLDADRKPFWETLLALNDQHPLYFFSSLNDHMELHEGGRAMSLRVVDGPFCAIAYWRDNQSFGRIPPATKPPLKWTLRYSLGIDPRLWAILAPMRVTLGPDDAGNVYTTTDASYKPHPENLRSNTYYGEADFTPPKNPGKFLSSMKIEGTIRIVTSDQYTIVDFAEPADREFKFANATFSVRCLVRPPTQRSPAPRTDFAIDVTAPGGKPEEPRIRLLDQPSVQVRAPMAAIPLVEYQFGFPAVPAPSFKLEVRMPRKIEERHVSFEIRNIPLPALPG